MSIDFALNRSPADSRIVVAMSGGVDSSVVAALAARTGAQVIGVTLQLYDHGEAVKRSGSCCAGQDIYDAKTVCDRLGIAHYVLDYESRFRSGVIDKFADEYARGRTPVPCSPAARAMAWRKSRSRALYPGVSALARLLAMSSPRRERTSRDVACTLTYWSRLRGMTHSSCRYIVVPVIRRSTQEEQSK